ncbi:MAG: ring-cleaving dioxygenase [Ktedonobacterales bacterium]|nr:ring-cleaving dioxygenase [Ktedonobacterales bacterium]
MPASISGIHHVTAIATDPQRTLDFYTRVLGLRLAKLTVNYDDPGTYHFYFGDELGRPGTILTFFPWPHAPRGRRGSDQVTAIAFSVPARALDFWAARLAEHGLAVAEPVTRFGDRIISFPDPDGLPLELVAASERDARPGWPAGPIVLEHAIRGFAGATLTVADDVPTAALLTETLGFRLTAREGERARFAVGAGAPGARVEVVRAPRARRGVVAAGTVHHIAWRTPDSEQQLAWRDILRARGLDVTPVRDRRYFHSIYFYEPGGILFEIATDPPGFATDEPPEALGTHLMLPPWLEPRRAALEGTLPPLVLPTSPF